MKEMSGRTTKWAIGVLCALAVGAYVMRASTPVGVTPTLIGRGTFDAFMVKSHNPDFKFKASAGPEVDFVVRIHDYAPGASTGWHTHPGPVFITVTQGEITFYEVDDPTCSPTVVRAGQGYVDDGHGHIARNETGSPAKDVTVIIAPVGGPFRGELPAPGPHCAF